MGVDINTIVAVYNEDTNLYNELTLKRVDINGKLRDVDIYSYRNTEMFRAMQNEEEDNYGHFPARDIRMNSLDEPLRKKIERFKDMDGCYGFREISLASMKNYVEKYPEVKDYDGTWETLEDVPMKTNPIKYLFDTIQVFIDFADFYGIMAEEDYNNFKLIYFFDC